MKLYRILLLILTLSLLLCSCRPHQPVDCEVDRSPVPFAVSREGLANAPQDRQGQAYSRLNQPLHLIPRELLQTASDRWIEYIQPEGIGVYYLYSYDAGETVNTYVVYLDIISQTLLPTKGFDYEIEHEYTFYVGQQRLQVSPGFMGAIRWAKATDTLSVWENPPLQPTVQISSMELTKGGEEIGTVLTDWLYSSTISDPTHQNHGTIPGTNVIADILRCLTVEKPYHALTDISYGIIHNPEENGAISEWSHAEYFHFTNPNHEKKNGFASYHNNHLSQGRLYNGMGIGGIRIHPNGKLTDPSHRMRIECNFSGIDPSFAKRLDWKINISISLEK